jgi:hypothetical protein
MQLWYMVIIVKIFGFYNAGRNPGKIIIAANASRKIVSRTKKDKFPPNKFLDYLPTASLSIRYSGKPTLAMSF